MTPNEPNEPGDVEEIDLPIVEPIIDENGDVIEYRSVFDD